MSHYAPFASLKSRSTSAGDSIQWLCQCTRLEFWWEVSLEHVLTIENPWAFFHPNLHLPKRYLTRSRKETNLRGQSLQEWANSSSNPQDLKKKDAGWRYKSPSGRPRFFGLQEHHWAAKFVEMHPLTPQQKYIIWNPSSRADSTSSQRAAVASHPVRFISWRSTNQGEKYPQQHELRLSLLVFSKSYI